MAVRRRRPLVPPPYPRRNRYTPPVVGTDCALPAPGCAESSQCSVVSPLPITNASLVCDGSLRFASPCRGPFWDIWQDTNGDCNTSRCRNVLQFHDISGFSKFYHQLHRRDFGQQPVEFVEQPRRVHSPARLGGPQRARRYPHLVAVRQVLKGRGTASDAAPRPGTPFSWGRGTPP